MLKNTDSLILEISKEKEILRMGIFEQKELALTIQRYSRVLFASEEINDFCQETTSILNKADKKGVLEPELVRAMKKNGQLLWDHLFTRAVKERLGSTHIDNLVLLLDEELISIPWELLYDGEEFLCLKFNLGRLIKTKQQVEMARYRSPTNTLKMLILANPTNDLKSAYSEGMQIKNQFERRRREISIDFKTTQIDKIYVKKNLRDYDIVHFAGHCEYEADDIKKSGWILNDGKFTIQDIVALGESLALPSLVFSNACYSAKVPVESLDNNYQSNTFNLASAFLFSGVRHYIGTIRRIEDTVSQIFAREFYTQLISGKSVGECMRRARIKLVVEYGMNSIAWTSYLLYGDTNFVMFKPKILAQQPDFSRLSLKSHKKLLLRIFSLLAILSGGIFLYFWLPSLNPSTYFLFKRSQKLFLAGKNAQVVAATSEIIKKDPAYSAVYPLLGETLERQGKRQEALRYYFDYAMLSEKEKNKKNLAASYISIGWIYQLTGAYPKALDFYQQAATLARQNKDPLNEAIALRKLAVWNIDKENYDLALELLTKSAEINRYRVKLPEYRHNLACDYFDIGLIFANKEDFEVAREFYHKSQAIFEKLKLKNELSDCYFNQGEMFLYEKQYQKALDCYLKGLKIDQALGNLPSLASDYQMLGELYKEMGDTIEAEKYFLQSISISRQIEAPLELASSSYSLALLYIEKGRKSKAREYLRQAQEIYSRVDTPDYKRIKQTFLELNNPA